MSVQDTHTSSAIGMESELVSQVDAVPPPAEQQSEKTDQTTEPTKQSHKRKSSPSSRHRNYRRRSVSESPEGSPDRRSPDHSPSSRRRSRNSDYRDDRRHRRRSRSRSRSRSPRRRRRSPSPRNLIHMMDLGPEVNGRLSTLLWKVEKLLENQEKVLKNQEKLLKFMEQHQAVPSSATLVSRERRLVNGVRSKDLEHSSTGELRIPSNLLESIGHFSSETVSDVHHKRKLTKTASKKLAECSVNPVEANGPSQDPSVSVHDHMNVVGEVSVPVKYDVHVPVYVPPVESDLDSGIVNCNDSSNTSDDHRESTSNVDRFKDLLSWAERLQKTSCSIGNFSVNLLKALFTKEEMLNRNCSGTRGKGALDRGKLDIIKFCAFKLYSIPDAEQDSIWKQKCVISIDEFLRRGNRSRVQGKSKDASVLGALDSSVIVELTNPDVKENKNEIAELS